MDADLLQRDTGRGVVAPQRGLPVQAGALVEEPVVEQEALGERGRVVREFGQHLRRRQVDGLHRDDRQTQRECDGPTDTHGKSRNHGQHSPSAILSLLLNVPRTLAQDDWIRFFLAKGGFGPPVRNQRESLPPWHAFVAGNNQALTPQQLDAIPVFPEVGLTDSRVAVEQFPCDRPTLRAGAMQSVTFTDKSTFEWLALEGAQSYNVYRGCLSDLSAGGSFGSCINDLDGDPDAES